MHFCVVPEIIQHFALHFGTVKDCPVEVQWEGATLQIIPIELDIGFFYVSGRSYPQI